MGEQEREAWEGQKGLEGVWLTEVQWVGGRDGDGEDGRGKEGGNLIPAKVLQSSLAGH